MIFSFIPKKILLIFYKPKDLLQHNILLSNSILLLLLIVAAHFWRENGHPDVTLGFCFFNKILSIPCPGCGITHGLLYFFSGDLLLAFQSNPASCFVGSFIIIQLIAMLFIIRDDMRVTGIIYKLKKYEVVVIGSLIVIWCWRVIIII